MDFCPNFRPKTTPRFLPAKLWPNGVKRSFRDASKPANFIIIIQNDEDEDVVPFTEENNLTGERLTLRQIDGDNWLLVRCPIGREEDKWTNWEKEAIEWEWRLHWNRIEINFKDGVTATEWMGPNEPTG
uniref:CS domain-containing protein n=1 Tax=Globodera pallida TaxID=36090 RepID=A0A183BX77_GLOPA